MTFLRATFLLTCGLLALCTLDKPAFAQTSPPNIVLLLADDLGYGDPGVYNAASKIPTPHLDRLAQSGMRFTDAHTPSGVCTPTRYALLTGRYSWRSRLKRGVLHGYSPALLEPGRATIASLLKAAGYRTGGVGKWHLGLGETEPVDYERALVPGPNQAGFDYFFGIPASLDMKPYLYFENDRAVVPPTDSTAGNLDCCFEAFWRSGPMAPDFVFEAVLPTLTQKAVDFIEDQTEDTPFFLYVPFPAPHTPWVPTEAFIGRSEAGTYGDFTAQVDWSVGRILDAIERKGFGEQTLVVFTSDNGAIWTQELTDRYDHRANGSLRGQKSDIWEGGHRVPFIARWTGKIPAGAVQDELIGLTDLMATFAAAAGVSLPADAGEDSFDRLPVFLGRDAPPRAPVIHHSGDGMFALRQGPWKLIEGLGSGGFTAPKRLEPEPGGPSGQLYNLETDPAETTNLYLQHPDVVARLQALLDQYRAQEHSRPRS